MAGRSHMFRHMTAMWTHGRNADVLESAWGVQLNQKEEDGIHFL